MEWTLLLSSFKILLLKSQQEEANAPQLSRSVQISLLLFIAFLSNGMKTRSAVRK
jgi:hypothetical protein